MVSEADISRNYNQTNLVDKIKLCMSDMEIKPSELTINDLSLFDQMHLGGNAAVKIVSQALNLNKNSNVLDLGCGLGGPARLIAEINNCKVEGIDLMPGYINDGNKLSEMVGLKDKVSLISGNVLNLPYENETFDASYMVHVGMNISNKLSLMKNVHRVLKNKAVYVIFDQIKLSNNKSKLPLPWASKQSQSSIGTIDDYKSCLTEAGFSILKFEIMNKLALKWIQKSIINLKNNNKKGLAFNSLIEKSFQEKYFNLIDEIKKGNLSPALIISMKHI